MKLCKVIKLIYQTLSQSSIFFVHTKKNEGNTSLKYNSHEFSILHINISFTTIFRADLQDKITKIR